MTRLTAFSAVLALAAATGAQAASVTTFTDLNTFTNASGSLTLIDFEGQVSNSGYTLGQQITQSGVTFTGKDVKNGIGISGPGGNIAGTPFDSALLFSNYSRPITATLSAGVYSVAGLFGGLRGVSSNASVSIFNGTTLLGSKTFSAPDMAPGQPGTFVGFTSDTMITSLVFTGVAQYEAIDDFRFGGKKSTGGGNVSPVPLPAGLPLLLSALGAAALLRRRD